APQKTIPLTFTDTCTAIRQRFMMCQTSLCVYSHTHSHTQNTHIMTFSFHLSHSFSLFIFFYLLLSLSPSLTFIHKCTLLTHVDLCTSTFSVAPLLPPFLLLSLSSP